MLKIDRERIARLPPAKQAEAKYLLEQYEKSVKANPMLAYVPHHKQVEFHSSRKQVKAFLGGNRSGKTTAGILDDLIQAVDRDCLPEHLLPYKRWDPPFYCRVVAPDFTGAMEGVIYQKLKEWVPRSQLEGGNWSKAYQKANRKLLFKNGSWFDFMTFEQDPDKFGGVALHRVHFDEEPPLVIRRECKMRLADYRGDELITMTPLMGLSWVFEDIWEPWTKGALKNGIVVTVDMDDNPHLDQEGKEEALAGLTQEEREARKQGKFVHFSGLIYPEYEASWHVIPELRSLPPDAQVYVGIDPGVRHLAAVLWGFIDNDNVLTIFQELGLQGHTVAQVAKAIHEINLRWGTKTDTGAVEPLRPRWYVIDPAARNIVHQTGRSDQMEFTDHGIITILGQNSVTAGINRVKERLQNERLFITANCEGLMEELRRYRWRPPPRTGVEDPKEAPVKVDDHRLDALRYLVASRPYTMPKTGASALGPLERMAILEQEGKRPKQQPKSAYGGIYF